MTAVDRLAQRKGERRIVVAGVLYFWRIPRRASANQEDLWQGLFVLVRRADRLRATSIDFSPKRHSDAWRGTYRTAAERAHRRELAQSGAFAAPEDAVTPRDVAAAIRAAAHRL